MWNEDRWQLHLLCDRAATAVVISGFADVLRKSTRCKFSIAHRALNLYRGHEVKNLVMSRWRGGRNVLQDTSVCTPRSEYK